MISSKARFASCFFVFSVLLLAACKNRQTTESALADTPGERGMVSYIIRNFDRIQTATDEQVRAQYTWEEGSPHDPAPHILDLHGGESTYLQCLSADPHSKVGVCLLPGTYDESNGLFALIISRKEQHSRFYEFTVRHLVDLD